MFPTITTASTDIQRLKDRCAEGDSDAWAAMVDRFQALVYSIPRRYGLNEDDAADVFMFAFEALRHNLDRIEAASAIPRWLATTAARESLRLRRFRSRTITDLPLEDVVDAEDAAADQEAVRADEARRVREALGQMASRCRDLLTALYVDDEPYVVVSERLSIPVGAIGPTRARCLEKLRAMLKTGGFFE